MNGQEGSGLKIDVSGIVGRINQLSVKQKVLLIAILSLVIHLIIASLVNNACDDRYWLIIMQNTETGNGSYGLDGNYYTPIWSYLLSAYSMFLKFTCSMTGWSAMFPSVSWVPLQPTPWMNILIKLPLIIGNLIVGYLIFKLVQKHTGNDNKAIVAMCLWCFCPIVVYMAAVQGQFDMLSVLFMLVCIFLLYDDRAFLAGIMFSASVFLKVFPVLCLLIFIAYLYAKHRNDGLILKKILTAAAGAILMTVILFIPIIINGELPIAFGFLLDRAGNSSAFNSVFKIALVLGAIAVMVIYSLKISKKKEDLDLTLLLYSGIMMTAANMISAGFQYIPSVIVFVIIFLYLSEDRHGYKNIYVLMTLSALLEGVFYMGTYGLVMISEFYGWVDIGLATQSLNVTIIGPLTTAGLAGIVRAVAVIIMFIFELVDTNDSNSWFCRSLNKLRTRGGDT